MKSNVIIREACVETFQQAVNAEQQGANRIELCGDLSVGGITPDEVLVQKVLEKLAIPVMVMVRPRGGDFVYKEEEFQQMLSSIARFKMMGVPGVVFGCLTADNLIDVAKVNALTVAAKPMEVTFHKAFDELDDLPSALLKLKEIEGIDRILTSGGALTAERGQMMLAKLNVLAAGKITILSAGKITDKNLKDLHASIGGREYHGKKIVGDLG